MRNWTFLGYRAKRSLRVNRNGLWEEVHSAGDPACPPPEGWSDGWDFNGAYCHNDPESALARVPQGDEGYTLYAYWLLMECLQEEGPVSEPTTIEEVFPSFAHFTALPVEEPPAGDFEFLGYDIVELAGYMGFGYSAFIDGYAREYPKNRFGLMDDLELALKAWPEVEDARYPDHVPNYVMRVARRAQV